MKVSLLLLALSLSWTAKTQVNTDSLWTIWRNTAEKDSNRLQALDKIIWKQYMYKQPDSAFILAKLQFQVAQSAGIQNLMAQALNSAGAANYVQGNHPVALEYFTKCLKIQEAMGSQKSIASTLNNIGIIYMEEGDKEKAMQNYTRSYELRKKLGDKKNMAIALNNIGNIQKSKGDFETALKTFQESLELKEAVNDSKGIATTLNNIGEVMTSLGRYHEALQYFVRSLNLRKSMNDEFGTAMCLANIGSIYQYQKNYLQAVSYGEKALGIAQKIEALEPTMDAASLLIDAYKSSGNYKKAVAMYGLFEASKDSLKNEENSKKIIQKTLQYEYQKKETADSLNFAKEQALAEMKHRAQLDQERNERYLLYGGLAFLFLLGAVSFWAYRQKRADNIQIEREKQRSDDLLLNILPKDTANELKQNGRAEAKHFDDVTVLFTDFKGFTAISEQLSAQELVDELDTCFRKFDEIVTKHGVEKIKTIGDAYMCVGGLPAANETHPFDVVHAALEIRDFMEEYNQYRMQAGKAFFQIRIGVHSGPVVAGIVGTKKFAYDVWGDTVNTASRMESSGEPGKVNISESTYRQVKDHFVCTFRGAVAAKNKGELAMYFVER